jgi:hypothetical protein
MEPHETGSDTTLEQSKPGSEKILNYLDRVWQPAEQKPRIGANEREMALSSETRDSSALPPCLRLVASNPVNSLLDTVCPHPVVAAVLPNAAEHFQMLMTIVTWLLAGLSLVFVGYLLWQLLTRKPRRRRRRESRLHRYSKDIGA